MRRIRMYNNVSADGYFADENGQLDWFVSDPEVFKAAVAGMPETDTVLFGRRTFDMFASFWPNVAAEAGKAQGPHGGSPNAETLAMARFLNEAKKVVFSKTLDKPSWKNSRVFHELNRATVESMKRETGKDIIIFGSGTIVSQLTQLGLIDVYDFIVNPVFLGKGKNLLEEAGARSKLRLVQSKSFPSGMLTTSYTRAS